MKILLLHSGNWEQPTGIITHITNLSKALVQRGHDVLVISRSDRQTSFKEEGVQYFLTPDIFKFYTRIRKEKKIADIIHCHDLLSLAVCIPRGKRSFVYTNHSVYADPEFHISYQEWQKIQKLGANKQFELNLLKLMGRYLLKEVKTIAVCKFVRATTSRIYGVPDPRIDVVYNGINIADFQKLDSESAQRRPNTILFIKPNEPRKGLHHMLESLPLVRKKVPDARLIAVGAEPVGNYRSFIWELISKYQIDDDVEFTGKIPFSTLLFWYQSSNVVVMPSVYEAFPLVALEAGICGKPVIGSVVGGMGEVIVNGKTGFCVDAKDPVILAHAIVEILQNPQLCRQMGEASRKRIIEEFTWEKIGAEVEKIYQEVRNNTTTTG